MARLFMVSVTHENITHWASIVNYRGSASKFEVSFFEELDLNNIPKIILEKKNDAFELAKDSPEIDEGLVKAVVNALEGYVVEKKLSL